MRMRSWTPRIIQDNKFSHRNKCNFFVIRIFQTLCIKWDFINTFYITIFQIRNQRDRTVPEWALSWSLDWPWGPILLTTETTGHQSLLTFMCGGYMKDAATCSRWFLARGFFYIEDGGDTFLRNVGSIHKIYTAPLQWKPQILHERSCLWMQGRHTRLLNSSHCWFGYTHELPKYSSLGYMFCCEAGRNMYRSWRQTFWTWNSSESLRSVKSCTTITCHSLLIMESCVVFKQSHFPHSQLCNRWKSYLCWYNIFQQKRHLKLWQSRETPCVAWVTESSAK
jgi:hypothetical protein